MEARTIPFHAVDAVGTALQLRKRRGGSEEGGPQPEDDHHLALLAGLVGCVIPDDDLPKQFITAARRDRHHGPRRDLGERLRTQGRRETHPGDDERHRRQCELQREGAGMAEPIAVA